MALVMVVTAPLDALYQTSPGRGRRAAVDAVLMIEPEPCLRMIGTTALVARKMDFTFTSKMR